MKYKTLTIITISTVLLTGCSLNNVTETVNPETSLTEQNQPANQEQSPEKNQEATDAAMMEENNTYTISEISEHDNADDCWLLIEGKVYDVTSYIDGGKHPGGAALLQGCGIDSTELYNNRPNGSGAHSDKARSFLPNFYIGNRAE